MLFLGVGIVLLVLKYLEIGPVATMSWTLVLAPFGLAVAWWSFADWSGYTKRKQEEKITKKAQDRKDKARAALGMGNPRTKR